MTIAFGHKPCTNLSDGALSPQWAEPLDQADEELRIARSQFLSGGRGYEVIVVVRAWPVPTVIERSLVGRRVPVLSDVG